MAAAPVAGKAVKKADETDLFWDAQRAALTGQPDVALKNYNRLLTKLPESAVAVDRLFDLAIAHGDLPSALKAARAQQLSNSGNAALPLIFFVDAWKKNDWAGARQAISWLEERNVYSFIVPILQSWVEVAQGKPGTITNAALRDNGLLYFYSFDQLIFLELAQGNDEGAKKRLNGFPGFGDDYARHMAMTAAEHLGRNGEGEYANSLLAHLGTEPNRFSGKSANFPTEIALAALFSRLSDQLDEQKVTEQALFFARLAHWVAPDSAFGRMTLASRLAAQKRPEAAVELLDGIVDTRPQWSWALGDKARILIAEGRKLEALKAIQEARKRQPDAMDLMLLEAQQQEANGDVAAATSLYRILAGMADADNAKNGRRLIYRLLLAQSLNAQNDWSGARTALEEALKLNGQNPEVLNSLGYGLLERREDVKRGFALVAKAYELAPQSPAITDSLGWGYYLNGEYDKAVPLLEKAVSDAMNDAIINEHLGDAYWKTGRMIEARYAWRSALLSAENGAAKRISTKIDLGWTEASAAP